MKRYFTLIVTLIAVILLQVNSCTMNPSNVNESPEIHQAEITGRLIYADIFNTY